MAWTSPKTFVAGFALTASELNTHLRDNMLEMPAAKATAANVGSYFVVDAPHRLIPRVRGKDAILTSESTTSNEYDDLATVGPQVSMTTGNKVLVMTSMEASTGAGGTNVSCRMSFDVKGATEIDPNDAWACVAMVNNVGSENQFMHMHPMTVTPGVNTFTAKYRSGVDGIAANFIRRRLMVFSFS